LSVIDSRLSASDFFPEMFPLSELLPASQPTGRMAPMTDSFAEAGFREVSRPTARRLVMRVDF
jgi:hypothetical protein